MKMFLTFEATLSLLIFFFSGIVSFHLTKEDVFENFLRNNLPKKATPLNFRASCQRQKRDQETPKGSILKKVPKKLTCSDRKTLLSLLFIFQRLSWSLMGWNSILESIKGRSSNSYSMNSSQPPMVVGYLVGWLFCGVLTLFRSFNTELSFKQFCLE